MRSKTTAGTLLALAFLWAESGAAAPVSDPFVRLDPRFDRIVPRDAKLEKLGDGFSWVEGPAWNREGGFLLFSDIPNNSVFKWKEGEGLSSFLEPSGYSGREPFTGREPGSNGLTFDREGRLVLCEHGDRRITRLERDGTKTALVDRYQGKRLNSPNDLVFKSNGDLYFTDPPFGLPGSFDDPDKELDFQGVYRLATDGRLTLLTRELEAPNGIAFSPDEKILYLSDSRRRVWMAYDVTEDGSIANGRVLLDLGEALEKYLAEHGGTAGRGLGVVDQTWNSIAVSPGVLEDILAEDEWLDA